MAWALRASFASARGVTIWATARSEGVELQANFQIAESFRVDLGGSWIDARLTEDVPALNAEDGNRLPGSPEEVFPFFADAAKDGVREPMLLQEDIHDAVAEFIYSELRRRPMVLPVVVEV